MMSPFPPLAVGTDFTRDPLTGALTRPFFSALLEREVIYADESGQPFALCLFDVDELCKINSETGFAAGDRVLAAAADALDQCLRTLALRGTQSVTARFDGDALIVLVRFAERETLAALAERALSMLAGNRLASDVRATLSAAIVLFEFGETTDALLARLEATLYTGKQFGLGRVEIAPSSGWQLPARLLELVG